MIQATHATRPVQILRESSRSLLASIRACMASPRTEAVHRLRTSTRRVEAQLALLSMLPGLPPHEEQRRKALRLLKRLRQSAGQVRDIDVQRDLIRAEAAAAAGTVPSDRSVRSEARRLRRSLKRTRDEEADHLRRLLGEHSEQLALVFKELLETLAPAKSLTVSETDLIALIRNWYGSHREATTPTKPRTPRPSCTISASEPSWRAIWPSPPPARPLPHTAWPRALSDCSKLAGIGTTAWCSQRLQPQSWAALPNFRGSSPRKPNRLCVHSSGV